MTDYSRLTAQQIAMQGAKLRYEQEKEIEKDNQDQLRQRQQTQNGTGYRNLHDLTQSDFHKTTIKTMNNNLKKQHIQRHLNNTIDNLDDDKLDDFAKQF
jgi:pyrroline-5-carboxylate reductase